MDQGLRKNGSRAGENGSRWGKWIKVGEKEIKVMEIEIKVKEKWIKEKGEIFTVEGKGIRLKRGKGIKDEGEGSRMKVRDQG